MVATIRIRKENYLATGASVISSLPPMQNPLRCGPGSIACHARKMFVRPRMCYTQHVRKAHQQCSSSSNQKPPGPRFRFRPVPAFAALLLAQLLVIWDVSRNTDIFETGNTGKFLSSSQFLPYTILHKDIVSPNSCVLTLRPGTYDGPVENWSGNALDAWRFRFRNGMGRAPVLTTRDIQNIRQYQDSLWREGIWSIEIKQPQMSITRQYTPLPPNLDLFEGPAVSAPSPSAQNGQDTGVFRLFIRREPEGEVSRYLYGLPEGATIELRGGFLDYQIHNDVTQLTFVAGGTGIAPALAAAYGFALRQSNADVRILWANRRREDCADGGKWSQQPAEDFSHYLMRKAKLVSPKPVPRQLYHLPSQTPSIVQQLDNLKFKNHQGFQGSFPRIDTKCFVDEEGTFIQKKDISNALSQPSGPGAQPNGKHLVLVSGPEGFVEHIAGPKLLRQGQELQGPRGGLLAQVDLKGWEVWKL